MAYTYSESAGQVGPPVRKWSDQEFEVLREFKRKIAEDENIISFFTERLEQQYIDGLTKLYNKTVAVDALHDGVSNKTAKTSTRRAWAELRDYTQREVDCREGLANALKEDVVSRLVALKDTQTRIRQRIKDDLKQATEAYEDQAHSKLPKLKKAYYAKTQALEEHAIAMQAKLLSESSPQQSPSHEKPHPFSPPAVVSSLPSSSSSPPTGDVPVPLPSNASVTFAAPQPPPERKGHGTGRNRAGSGSALNLTGDVRPKEVLSDIAAQSKKGFSAIMQRFGAERGDKERDDGAFSSLTPDESGLQRRGTATGARDFKALNAQKGVKAKREAEEADKAYRLGVFHLESLRLRREKLQTSAMGSLQQFNDELNSTLVASLDSCVTALHATGLTLAQATDVAKKAIADVNLEADAVVFSSHLPAPSAQRIAPVLYENFYVGPCKSLIFGISLTDYDYARGEGGDHGRPPLIVEKCVAHVDSKLEAEGLYRISGRQTAVHKMIQDVERDEDAFQIAETDDVHVVCSVLKQYLRDLPEPLFPLPHAERVKYTENRETHIHSSFSALRARLRRLQPIHQTTFQAIVEHLGRVQAHSSSNKMGASNLAVVFSSVIFGQEQLPADGNLLAMHQEKDTVLEDIVTHSDLLFSASATDNVPGLLPPGAALSRSGVISYHPVDDGPQPGSSRTRLQYVNVEEPGTSGDLPAASAPSSTAPVSSEHAVTTMLAPMTASAPVAPIFPPPQFTPESVLTLLFDPSLIPDSLRTTIGDDLHVRPLASDDFLRSHFGLLSTLSTAPPLAPSVYASLFRSMQACADTYHTVVIIERQTDQMVASATLIVERKFIHGAGRAAHIEDVVISPRMQGQGLGAKLVKGLKDMATDLGCYKTILDCKENKTGFYEKCGQMAFYVPESEMAGDGNRAHTDGKKQEAMHVHSTLRDNGDDAASEGSAATESASESGVTYRFPVGLTPLADASSVAAGAASADVGEPARATSPLASLGSGSRRTPSPLPPGAAPPTL